MIAYMDVEGMDFLRGVPKNGAQVINLGSCLYPLTISLAYFWLF